MGTPLYERRSNRWRFGNDACPYWNVILNRPPRDTPPAFWKSIVRIKRVLRVTSALIVSMAGIIVVGTIVSDSFTRRRIERFGFVILGTSLVVHVAVYACGVRKARGEFARFLEQHAGKVCTTCGYVLTGLPAESRCPECGDHYLVSHVVAYWREWLERNIQYE